jgi:hypothetical protein
VKENHALSRPAWVRPFDREKLGSQKEFHPADKVLGQMPIMSGGEPIMIKALPGDALSLSFVSSLAERE